jgi:prepilin-type N-terminal cleavage/methylation domain-containing protein
MLRTRRGFTLVEIIVVITVIAILTGVGIFGFITYQQQGRNTERQTQTKLIAEALEKYYDENGEYPGCGAMTTPDPQTIVTNTLKNLSTDVFKAPRSPATVKISPHQLSEIYLHTSARTVLHVSRGQHVQNGN